MPESKTPIGRGLLMQRETPRNAQALQLCRLSLDQERRNMLHATAVPNLQTRCTFG